MNINDLQKRDEIIYGDFDAEIYKGESRGDRHFNNLTYKQLKKLCDEDLLNLMPDTTPYDAPTIDTLMKFVKKWGTENYVFIGMTDKFTIYIWAIQSTRLMMTSTGTSMDEIKAFTAFAKKYGAKMSNSFTGEMTWK